MEGNLTIFLGTICSYFIICFGNNLSKFTENGKLYNITMFSLR